MKQIHSLKTAWVSILVGILIATHGLVLYRVSSHMAWTAVSGLTLIVLLKHDGLLGRFTRFSSVATEVSFEGDCRDLGHQKLAGHSHFSRSDVAGYRSTYCANVLLARSLTPLVTFLGWSQTYELLVQYEILKDLVRATRRTCARRILLYVLAGKQPEIVRLVQWTGIGPPHCRSD